MSNARKLQTEIDRVLKKVDEGVEFFQEIWEKVYSAEQQSQKEKHEQDLKKEIKKLQRLRDQIKTWIGSSEVKDKDALVEARKLIETKMELFKVCEKETKTKTYSKEGLAREEKLDPAEEAKRNTTAWITDCIERLRQLVQDREVEIERLQAGKGKKSNKIIIDEYMKFNLNHKFHVSKLEGIMRLVNNDRLDPELVDAIKDDLDYYIDSYEEDEYQQAYDENFFYESLGLDELDVVVVDRVTQAQPPPSNKKASNDDSGSQASSSKTDKGDANKKTAKKPPTATVIPVTIGRARVSSTGDIKPGTTITTTTTTTPMMTTTSGTMVPPPTSLASAVSASIPTSILASNNHATPTNSPSPITSGTSGGMGSTSTSPTMAGSSTSVTPIKLGRTTSAPVSVNTIPANNPILGTATTTAGAATAVTTSATTLLSASTTTTSTTAGTTVNNAVRRTTPTPNVMATGGASMAAILKRDSEQQEKERQKALQQQMQQQQQQLLREQQARAAQAAEQLRQQQQQQLAQRQQQEAQLHLQRQQQQQQQEALRQKAAVAAAQQEALQRQQQEQVIRQQQQQQEEATAKQQQQQSQLQQQQQQQQPRSQAGVGLDTLASGLGGLSLGNLDGGILGGIGDTTSAAGTGSKALPPALVAISLNPTSLSAVTSSSASTAISQNRLSTTATTTSSSSSTATTTAATGVSFDAATSSYLSVLNESLTTIPHGSESERSRPYTPSNPYPTPSCYPSAPSSLFDNPAVFEKLGTDCLFFIFYYAQGTYQQYLAARELKKQSWRFHKKFMTWFQRHEEPKVTTDEYEQGTYVYFDYESGWCTRIKSDFRFEYIYLEDSLQ